ncbi:hypothetical protein [Pseudomonas frederiksbergensis]|uniref:hypothetical protein n=1 Tax=Pseudomonas frederiksbergensis TaxID=104087 RepID=UPI003D1AE686
MLDHLAAQVVAGLCQAVSIGEALDVWLGVFFQGDNAQLIVIGGSPVVGALVPVLQHFTADPEQAQTPTGIDAVDPHGGAGQLIDRDHIRCRRVIEQSGVPLFDSAARNVVEVTVDECFHCCTRDLAQVLDPTNDKASAVVDT